MTTITLTASQALVRYLVAQQVEVDGERLPLVAGVWAIFGHGNVAGLGEALSAARSELPTLRGHNEQGMAHAAIAYAKACNRRRVMACTTSIGPGATNLVTAAALAHVNRLPLLLLPGDNFASRAPDPVLQQLEVPGDPGASVNDTLRSVSRYWDRIQRPQQLLSSLPRAMAVLTDPAECGPVTLAMPQDVQTEAWEFPLDFFEPRLLQWRRPAPDQGELARAVALLREAEKPLLIAGGGVHYAGACALLDGWARVAGLPVAETQAGKGALPWDHPMLMGSVGVTGSSAANELAAEADLVICLGTRLQDFTTASRTLFRNPRCKLLGINVAAVDAAKHGASSLVADAQVALRALGEALPDWRVAPAWVERATRAAGAWQVVVDRVTAADDTQLPSDAQVLGAVNRGAAEDAVVVCAAGGLPGELHKLWRCSRPNGYHVEYGYSCMGYEIAGGLGVTLALPGREVYVLVGDGSYLMLNSELATAVMLGRKMVVVLLDNRGFACINRLQQNCGGDPFNNLLADSVHGGDAPPAIDFAAHARALGAQAEQVTGIAALESALARARRAEGCYVVVIRTDPDRATAEGGAWWEVAVPEVSQSDTVRQARAGYRDNKTHQRRGG
ncbi:3D-(3,5/4)-trihydroxycyclohexane-1,2-dione acylhydrolase (decyclizing) [Parahaliea mediterranea]|uniref:3D-(3,5/4)-trihydroxycyclohexane-1,2-dione acylhydrolase (Decyclizing) n=1 Tax=Parahaliea mediterranea TaxID=651086 RepID=A0A939DE45_9GAMM|nr:3D-(3,5/4)-trihydroxycyclohexane-1,2-dione acylhydrolase (decyclizing) [Parahaliea mediterranea]MBN7796389.1 3D-(3,5/4)-trihydroxycyclohexane-1,2-dione acylhydrolase (decyclizing) [Parahaliea mediterranea]